MTREYNRGRAEIRVLDCMEVTPERVGFPGARMIARLRRRVRRRGKKTTETDYLITSLTLEQLKAQGWLKLKRGYWIIESSLHHALDVSLDEDRSRVRNPNAAMILGMFRRLTVSIAQAAIREVRAPNTRLSVRRYQQQFSRRNTGSKRLNALIFAKSPNSRRLQK